MATLSSYTSKVPARDVVWPRRLRACPSERDTSMGSCMVLTTNLARTDYIPFETLMGR